MRAYVLSDAPIAAGSPGRPPAAEFDAAAALAAWHLPVRALPAHGVVLEAGEAGLAGALALTAKIAGALAETKDALVLFGAALSDREAFLEQAADASPDDPPIFLWVAFELRAHEDGTRSLLTHGARDVGAPMEVEIDRSRRDPEALLERAADAVLVGLFAGAEVEDGGTIELSEDAVRVRVQPSLRGDGSKAWRLRVP
jgi:hypothetical protein